MQSMSDAAIALTMLLLGIAIGRRIRSRPPVQDGPTPEDILSQQWNMRWDI